MFRRLVKRHITNTHNGTEMAIIKNGDRILFQGDSITDAGRGSTPDGLGGGYVSIIQGLLAAKRPELTCSIINRGVGGDRTFELLARWQKDCVDLKPDVLSIKIGVNDVWRLQGEWNGQKFVTFAEYKANYLKLLDMSKAAGIRQLILLSPSAIADNKDEKFACHLDERMACVKELAAAYNAVYVPIREVQKQALRQYPDVKWTSDGCHPTTAGHALFAQAWLDAMGV